MVYTYTYTTLDDPLATNGTWAAGINNAGQIVGSYGDGTGLHGFLYNNATYTTLDDPSATNGTQALDINNTGEIVGNYYDGSGAYGFLYSGGVYTTLGPGDLQTHASGINDADVIVGDYLDGGADHGFLFSLHVGTYYTIDDPSAGQGGNNGTMAIGVNAPGAGTQIVGSYYDGKGTHGFLYSNGAYTILDDPLAAGVTVAKGINDAGQIVGNYFDSANISHSFIYSNGVYTTIDPPGAQSSDAYGINDGGQIVGSCSIDNASHGFLASPLPLPGVLSVAASPGSGDFNAGNKITITLDMNEAVKVIGKPTLALNDGGTANYNATLSSPTALVFTYTVAAAQNALELEITGINLPSGASIKDSQGNNAALSGAVANLGLQIDTAQPTVSNIAASPSTGDLNAGKTVAITLNMSEAVTVLGSPTVRLSDEGIATFDAAHSTSTALAFDYTVATGQNTSDLQLTGVNLPSGAAIQDLAGNKAILSRVTADLELQIDTKAPTVTKVLASPSTGDLNAGNTVAITLDLSEPMMVKGSPTLALNDGGIATYNLAASTSTSLVFDYLVTAGENTAALQVTGVNLVAGAAIQDLAGNNANLAGGAANLHLTIDTTPPTVSKVVSSPSSGEVTTGHTTRIMLDMSEAVTVSGAPTLLLNNSGTATYDAAHSTGKVLAFDYMPSSGQVTTDLMVSGIELASTSSIQDLAGNNASLAGGGANLGLGINAKPSGTAGPSGGNLAISGSQELELFGASVANVTLGGDSSGILKLDTSATFAGTVAGLASGNYLDLADLPYRGNNAPAYNSTGPNTGTLAVTERTSTINIALLGNYMANSFVASSDGHGGTVVSEPPLSESQFLTTPHT
jgi:hypothetical protein